MKINKKYAILSIYLYTTYALFSQANTIEKEHVTIMNAKIEQVAEALSMFKINKSVDELEKAVRLMGHVPYPAKTETGVALTMRHEQATMWLNILTIIDNNIKKDDEGYSISINLIPPMTSDGIQYPSGVDPKVIKDPKARERYEFELQENNNKMIQAVFQNELKNTSRLAITIAGIFFKTNYTSSKEDQKELDNLFSEQGLSPNQINALRH